MNQRTKIILEAAIKEYIKEGEPVSSKELAKKYDFGVQAASIRNELNTLTKEGFLTQPHTSGGRIPTDKGYQFFVENSLENAVVSKKILGQHNLKLNKGLRRGNFSDLIEGFAQESKLLGAGSENGQQVYKFGLDDLVSQLDVETKDDFYNIVRDFEMLDQRLKEWGRQALGDWANPQVFIGKRSPITKSENLSVIMDCFDNGDHKILIALIGPKRMDYEKNIKLFKSLHKEN